MEISEIVSLISDVCSILGFIISLVVVDKVAKLTINNSNSHNKSNNKINNSGDIAMGDHSATSGSQVIHADKGNINIGNVDVIPEVDKDEYLIVNGSGFLYNLDVAKETCQLISKSGKNELVFAVDFEQEDVQKGHDPFVGYALTSLPKQDWRGFVKEGCVLLFDYEKEGTISNISVELTNKQRNKKVLKENLDLGDNKETYKLDLKQYNDFLDDWKSVDEICFVFFPNEVAKQKGTVKITNMRIEKVR